VRKRVEGRCGKEDNLINCANRNEARSEYRANKYRFCQPCVSSKLASHVGVVGSGKLGEAYQSLGLLSGPGTQKKGNRREILGTNAYVDQEITEALCVRK